MVHKLRKEHFVGYSSNFQVALCGSFFLGHSFINIGPELEVLYVAP